MKKKSAPILLMQRTITVNASTIAPFYFKDRPIFKRRWAEWEPWVLLDLRRKGISDPPTSPELERLKNTHREALYRLLRLGVAMRTIRRNKLDDPRLSEEQRADWISLYLARHVPEKPTL